MARPKKALNFAALRHLPVLFVCENNQYSSHLPLAERRPMRELWPLADAYSIPAIRIDGNDVLAVYAAAQEAVARARRGDGPTFLECMTFRWRGHVGPRDDLDVGIRDPAELAAWIARCPIKALERDMVATGEMTEDDLAGARERVHASVEAAFARARATPTTDPARVAEYVYVQG
jgi:acetoin:2,6-dichlorophenolindophenol oxidoreductase subunit alpha